MKRREFLLASSVFSGLDENSKSATVSISNPVITVNVTRIGAKGNGANDDTSVIQRALDSGVSKVHVPAGRYVVSTLTIPSETAMYGDGPATTIFEQKAGANAPVIQTRGDTSNVKLSEFGINGNAGKQQRGNRSGIFFDSASTDCTIENVHVSEVADWAFYVAGTGIVLRGCIGENVTGATGPFAVRAAFLLGASLPKKTVGNIVLDGCVARDCLTPFTDGFILENGSNVVASNCRVSGISLTGFKIKTDQTQVLNCFAENCLTGFQVQGPLRHLALVGNMAFRNSGAGFQFNQTDSKNSGLAWLVSNNISIENGQGGTAGTRYGFAFENVAGCTTDGLLLANNLAIDNQSPPTQARGISFGQNGVFANVIATGNFCNGNLLDIYYGASLQSSTALRSWSNGNTPLSYPTSVYRCNFWVSNVGANSSIDRLADGLSGRGYVVPKSGFIRFLLVRATRPIKEGAAMFFLRVNDVTIHELTCRIDSKNPVLNIIERPIFSNQLMAGDVISVSCNTNSELISDGALGFDVIAEICY